MSGTRRPRRPDARQEDRAAGLPLRVAMMDVERRRKARKLRRQGYGPDEIAARLDASVEQVIAALGALRGKRQNPNHTNLSVTAATGRFFRSLAEPGEPTWQVMDRIAVLLRGYLADTKRRPSRPANDDRRDLFGGPL